MTRFAGVLLVLVALCFGSPDRSSAQSRPEAREGFFMGIGLGWGSMGCSDCAGEREPGVSGYLKLGGTVNPRLLLGFELNAWTRERNNTTRSQGNASVVAFFYPQARRGFFLKGGVGVSTLDRGISEPGYDPQTGIGFLAGAGYDVRVGNNVSLTPYANVVYGKFDEGSTNVFQAGLGLSWH